jgi:hypothetical protein
MRKVPVQIIETVLNFLLLRRKITILFEVG